MIPYPGVPMSIQPRWGAHMNILLTALLVETGSHLCDIAVSALHQTIQIEPSNPTSFRLVTECLLAMTTNATVSPAD